jgi:hypothetical protein
MLIKHELFNSSETEYKSLSFIFLIVSNISNDLLKACEKVWYLPHLERALTSVAYKWYFYLLL